MKRLLSFLMAVILLAAPLCVETYASDDVDSYENIVMPRYSNLASIAASATEKSLGFISCMSNVVTVTNDRTYVITCTLQRTDGSSAWEDYKYETKTFTDGGSHSVEKIWFAPANYAYRVESYLVVKNKAGTVIETACVKSNVVYR